MQYRKLTKDGDDISVLGYGCLRFPTKGNKIDEALTEEQLLLAFQHGVNYFDTAYPYHNGKSEVVLGKFINKHKIRDKVYIADKLPTFLVHKSEQIHKFFNTQLERLNTNYIDYYLMHMLDSVESFNKLVNLGLLQFLEEKKKSGQIRFIGFSFHGKPSDFLKLLEVYPWDFCQIQYNYLDEYNQAGKAGLLRAYELGIGVAVMEPLRGGSLAGNAPKKVVDIFSKYHEKRSAAYWGLRFVLNHEQVAVVLSGMNEIDHILDNINVACDTLPNSMNEEEHNIISKVKDIYRTLMQVPCTACGYCMPCPHGVDIPGTFFYYNSKYFFGKKSLHYVYRAAGGAVSGKCGGDLCVSCNQCTKHCPQQIDIPAELKNAHKELNRPLLNSILSLYFKFTHRSD